MWLGVMAGKSPRKKPFKDIEDDKIIPFGMPPLAPEEPNDLRGMFSPNNEHENKKYLTHHDYYEKKDYKTLDNYIYEHNKKPSLSAAFNKAASPEPKPTPTFLVVANQNAKGLDGAARFIDVPVPIPARPYTPPPKEERGPSLFERIGEGLRRAFTAAYDMAMEAHRRKVLFDQSMQAIDHALFVRPKDAQVWLLRADVAREMDAIEGRHYFNHPSFGDMPAHLREGVDRARREIAFQTITGPLRESAGTITKGGAPYDLPKRFILSERHIKQALKVLEEINEALGTPKDNIDAWVRREEAAEEMAALMGEAIPADILASLPEELAQEIDAKRRFVAFQRLTGPMKDEALALKASEHTQSLEHRKDLH